MNASEPVHEIKFSKVQPVFSFFIIVGLYEGILNLLKQGQLNHNYVWYIVFVVVVNFIIRNFIRITVFLLIGVPAIAISKSDITLTQAGYVIEWDDITEINLQVHSGRSTSYNLVVSVKEPWKYISTIRNPLRRYYTWYTQQYFQRAFSIDLNIVEGDSQSIFDTVEDCFHLYRHKAI